MVLRSSPGGANVDISFVLAVFLELRCFVFLMCFLWFVNVIIFSKIYKTETFSVVIVGGTNVDISMVLKLFVKCTHSSQRRFFHNFFDMFRRNTEFL